MSSAATRRAYYRKLRKAGRCYDCGGVAQPTRARCRTCAWTHCEREKARQRAKAQTVAA